MQILCLSRSSLPPSLRIQFWKEQILWWFERNFSLHDLHTCLVSETTDLQKKICHLEERDAGEQESPISMVPHSYGLGQLSKFISLVYREGESSLVEFSHCKVNGAIIPYNLETTFLLMKSQTAIADLPSIYNQLLFQDLCFSVKFYFIVFKLLNLTNQDCFFLNFSFFALNLSVFATAADY